MVNEHCILMAFVLLVGPVVGLTVYMHVESKKFERWRNDVHMSIARNAEDDAQEHRKNSRKYP